MKQKGVTLQKSNLLMQKLIIKGNKELSGKIFISGSKIKPAYFMHQFYQMKFI